MHFVRARDVTPLGDSRTERTGALILPSLSLSLSPSPSAYLPP